MGTGLISAMVIQTILYPAGDNVDNTSAATDRGPKNLKAASSSIRLEYVGIPHTGMNE